MSNLQGKTAVITGSTRGIGLGLAKGLAGAGMNIVLNGLSNPEKVAPVVQEIEGLGVSCIFHGADMTQPEQIEGLINKAQSHFGSVDVLINNAGIQHVSPVEEFPTSKWDAILAINLSSAFHTIRTAVPLMKQQGWGRIINIASAHGLVASPYKSAYVAAKHGIVGLTKTIALEVAEDNITVNAICPGYVHTPMVDNQIADTAKARGMSEKEVVEKVLLAAQATKKFVTVEELSGVAQFLCSDAAANITGTAMPVEGGWTAQ